MPSPKAGTVTNDIVKAIEDLRKGKVEFRVDKQAGVHLSVGKISFTPEQIYDNASSVIEALNEARPVSVKGKFIRSLCFASSMNPGVMINI
jgi:large subunit ribosomal protein L1